MDFDTELLDAEEDATCCRICRLSASDDRPLFTPCKCSGSIKHVHQDCLMSWLNHSGRQRCEVSWNHPLCNYQGRRTSSAFRAIEGLAQTRWKSTVLVMDCSSPHIWTSEPWPAICFCQQLNLVQLCNHAFQFRPVYAQDAPSRLPWTDLAWALARKSCSGLLLCIRVNSCSGKIAIPPPVACTCKRFMSQAGTKQTCCKMVEIATEARSFSLAVDLRDYCAQAAIVAQVWLFLVPLLTCWMWRLSFMNPLVEVSWSISMHLT